MTPSARVQAAIELLDMVIAAARNRGAPADRVLSQWFSTRRFAGSADRRAIRDLVFGAIRACGPVPVSGRAAMLRLIEMNPSLASLFDGSPHGPAPITSSDRAAQAGVAPDWLEAMLTLSDITGEAALSLLERAPLDIRRNTLKTPTPDLPLAGETLVAQQGVRLPMGTHVEQWSAYRDGHIEIQDAGSQLACEAVCARAGETVIDLCAGAGGKTLALAAAMGMGEGANIQGRLIACDVDRARLARLAPRAHRAGARIETRLLNPGCEAAMLADVAQRVDAVLVDAPCSGTGTWRRQPESRWRLTSAELTRLTALQMRLLDLAAGLVRPGGRLIYVTCSLLDAEGADQFAAFLARHPGWQSEIPECAAGEPRGAGLRLSPYRDGTDGFFIALARRL